MSTIKFKCAEEQARENADAQFIIEVNLHLSSSPLTSYEKSWAFGLREEGFNASRVAAEIKLSRCYS